MAENISIEMVGITEIQHQLRNLRRFMPISSQNLGKMALIWEEGIKRRTLLGRDSENKAFERYSPQYASFRSKTGHITQPVNLFYRGHMLAAMTHATSKNKIRIYFRTAKEGLKAHGHHFGSSKTGLPARPFFDLNEDDLERAVDFLGRVYDNRINR